MMRIQTVVGAALMCVLAGCSSNDEANSVTQKHVFDYGPTVEAPTVEHIITFTEGDFELSDEAKQRLAPHIKHLIANPWSSVKLQGNSSKSGGTNANYEYGIKRATAVKRYFLAEGVDESQVSISSVGEISVPGFPSRAVILSY